MGIIDKIKDAKKGYDTLLDALGGKAPQPQPPKQEPPKPAPKTPPQPQKSKYDDGDIWS